MTKKNIKQGTKSGSGSDKKSPSAVRKEHWRHVLTSLYIEGHSMEKVAEIASNQLKHSFSKSTVHKYVSESIKAWREADAKIISDRQALELAKLDQLEMYYWDCFHKSRNPSRKTIETKEKDPKNNRLVVVSKKEEEVEEVGNPRYLEGVQKCIELRMKLLGDFIPQQINIGSNVQNVSNSTVIKRQIIFGVRKTTIEDQEINMNDE